MAAPDDARPSLTLDHLTVVAPTLAEGAAHVRDRLGIDVPFGQRHAYMGTHNHLLRLGGSVYLEIVAIDPQGAAPARARWFGLDDRAAVVADWDAGRRLRGWVARTDGLDAVLAGHGRVFGAKVPLPWREPVFDFALRDDGSLPFGGAAPALIDRRGQARSMATIAEAGAQLLSFALEHPDVEALAAFHRQFAIDRPPEIRPGAGLRYRARIDTPADVRELT